MAKSGNSKMKSELSKTDIQIVVIVLILLVTIALGVVEYMFWFSPKGEEIDQANQTLAGLQTKVQEAKRVPQQIKSYQQQIDALEGKTSEGGEVEDTELRQEIDVPTILAIVESSATQANLKLSSITMDGNAAYIKGGVIAGEQQPQAPNPDGTTEPDPSAPVTGADFYKLGIAMEVTSVTYNDLMQFLGNVEDAGYYITTSSASLSTEDGNIYKGNLNFYIYSFVASSK